MPGVPGDGAVYVDDAADFSEPEEQILVERKLETFVESSNPSNRVEPRDTSRLWDEVWADGHQPLCSRTEAAHRQMVRDRDDAKEPEATIVLHQWGPVI